MAHPVVTTRSRRMRGGTLLGFMIGLIFGLSIAVVVAMIVTRAPVPFVNKALQSLKDDGTLDALINEWLPVPADLSQIAE